MLALISVGCRLAIEDQNMSNHKSVTEIVVSPFEEQSIARKATAKTCDDEMAAVHTFFISRV